MGNWDVTRDLTRPRHKAWRTSYLPKGESEGGEGSGTEMRSGPGRIFPKCSNPYETETQITTWIIISVPEMSQLNNRKFRQPSRNHKLLQNAFKKRMWNQWFRTRNWSELRLQKWARRIIKCFKNHKTPLVFVSGTAWCCACTGSARGNIIKPIRIHTLAQNTV